MLELQNITKIYRKGSKSFTALKSINLKIDKGDFCTVLGPSGAGKSTLLHLIGGLIRPDSGSITYNNRDIYQMSGQELDNYRRKHLGFMFQQFYLMPYLTVLDNIKLAISNENNKSGITDYFLQKCNLTELIHKYPSELSVGEKQRTAFIRAIISNPAILLADEPTGNLDPANSKILLSLILDFNKNGGTVLLVSHDPETLKFSNKRITLNTGNLVTAV